MPGSGSSSDGQVNDASQAGCKDEQSLPPVLAWDLGPSVCPAHANLLSDVLRSRLYLVSSSLLVKEVAGSYSFLQPR